MTRSQEQILKEKINNRALRRTYHKGSRSPDPLPESAKRQMQHKPYARDWSDADADDKKETEQLQKIAAGDSLAGI